MCLIPSAQLGAHHLLLPSERALFLFSCHGRYSWEGDFLGSWNPRAPSTTDLGSDSVLNPDDLDLASCLGLDQGLPMPGGPVPGDAVGNADGDADDEPGYGPGVYFASGTSLYRYDLASGGLADLKRFSGAAAWFTCGGALQDQVERALGAIAVVVVAAAAAAVVVQCAVLLPARYLVACCAKVQSKGTNPL